MECWKLSAETRPRRFTLHCPPYLPPADVTYAALTEWCFCKVSVFGQWATVKDASLLKWNKALKTTLPLIMFARSRFWAKPHLTYCANTERLEDFYQSSVCVVCWKISKRLLKSCIWHLIYFLDKTIIFWQILHSYILVTRWYLVHVIHWLHHYVLLLSVIQIHKS